MTATSPQNEVHSIREQSGRVLSARLEPFDSYWQAPEDVEAGYKSFYEYYRHNYLPRMPADKSARILVISSGPGYLLNVLKDHGYGDVLGIDSDSSKVEMATGRGLNAQTATAFEFLGDNREPYDVIIPEQELNHLSLAETVEFLKLCHRNLTDGGLIFVYGLNGANPIVGAENLTHNIDHFYAMTENSVTQLLQLGGFRKIQPLPLKIYVFWKNPLNYVGLVVTGVLEFMFRLLFKIYGKDVTILTKKIAATAIK